MGVNPPFLIMYLDKTIKSDAFKISKEEIIEFATKYDPMFFHLDESKAEESIFSELVLSGLHTICIILQKMNVIYLYLKPQFPHVQFPIF